MVKRLKELYAPSMRWYFIALLWFGFAVLTGFLLAFRTIKTSGFAQLIDFGNVPLLSFTDTHYPAFYWGSVIAGAIAWLLIPVLFLRFSPRVHAAAEFAEAAEISESSKVFSLRFMLSALSPARILLMAVSGVCIGLAAWLSRSTAAEDASSAVVSAPGWPDILLVLLAIISALLFHTAFSSTAPEVLEEVDMQPELEPRPADTLVHLAAIYLLGTASMVILAVLDHLEFWDPQRNGGYQFRKFFEDGEMGAANLVLFSTSLLFASLGGLAACAGYGIFRLLSAPQHLGGPRHRARDCGRLAIAGSALWTVALMGPWQFKILPEIRAEGAWIMPLGIWGLSFAALAPLYAIGGLLVRRDAEASALVSVAGAKAVLPERQECAFITFLLFPIYPWLRLLRPGSARVCRIVLMFLAALAVGTFTWFVHEFEKWYEFEDWRGMLKAGQLPFLRAYFSLGTAGFLYLFFQRTVLWWRDRRTAVTANETPISATVLVEAPAWQVCGANQGSLPEVQAFMTGSLQAAEVLGLGAHGGTARGVALQPVCSGPSWNGPSASEGSFPSAQPVLLRGARWVLLLLAVCALLGASWPFWGWRGVPQNVFARTWEFSSRHKFELGFLHWLLDFDRDGYSSVLHGSDVDDWNAEVQGGGLARPHPVEVFPDQFAIQDPERARNLPNVVLLYLEGVTPKSISVYGLRNLSGGAKSTPHLDALANAGTRFTRARCGYPSTWDGWFAVQSGRTLRVMEMDASKPFGERYSRFNNLHKVLKLSGIERWCHPNIRPFSELLVPEANRAEDWDGDFDSSLSSDEENQQGLWRGDKRNARILRFIDTLKPGERFFISEHMSDTHFPWKRTALERAQQLGFPNGLEFVEEDARLNGALWDKQARYYQTVTRMDAQVGALVERLKARGLFENTLFVIVGDHGCQWYEHEHGYYVSHLYEQSLQLPLIVKAPGFPAGQVCDANVLQVDVLPSVMELAGVRMIEAQVPRPLPGQSFVPYLRGEGNEALAERFRKRDMLLTTHYDTNGVIVGFHYKLIFDRPAGTYLLFDLEADPLEMHNLADVSPELLAVMQERLRQLAQEHRAFLGGILP